MKKIGVSQKIKKVKKKKFTGHVVGVSLGNNLRGENQKRGRKKSLAYKLNCTEIRYPYIETNIKKIKIK